MSNFVSAMIMMIMVLISIGISCDVLTESLCVNQVSESGFGDERNQYALAMETFQGSVYVATLNAKDFPDSIADYFLGLPFKTKGVDIYKGDMDGSSEWIWTRVVKKGLDNKLNYGVHNFAVVGDADNYLYAVTGNHEKGFEIWRTSDGVTWEIIMEGGFGDIDNISGRGLIAWDGYLYVGVENRKTGGKIFRRPIDANGDFIGIWVEVVNDGLGDIHNLLFSDFAVYGGYLYTGTLNLLGMELWRTADGVIWENIFKEGNGNPDELAIMQLYVYSGKLYFGTMNFDQGSSLWVNDDFVGTVFVTVFIGGFDNQYNYYVWSLQEFYLENQDIPPPDGETRLFVGTFDPITFGFDLFSSRIPGESDWFIETRTAFGYHGYYGITAMTVIDDKLMIGTATPSDQLGCIIFEATSNWSPDTTYNRTIINHHNDNKTMAYNYNETDYEYYYYIKQKVCNNMNITLKKQFCDTTL